MSAKLRHEITVSPWKFWQLVQWKENGERYQLVFKRKVKAEEYAEALKRGASNVELEEFERSRFE